MPLSEMYNDEQKKLAGSITALVSSPEWKLVAEYIETLKQNHCQAPEFYFADETKSLLSIDTGARTGLTELTNWLEMQVNLVNALAEEQKKLSELNANPLSNP